MATVLEISRLGGSASKPKELAGAKRRSIDKSPSRIGDNCRNLDLNLAKVKRAMGLGLGRLSSGWRKI
ncbi:hypothetical protein NW762_014721 [Fusarium torreyae]|uniref:Uncharacterized protein n=1 Tax=Fusarium torreyae TaxID=1237075 RepID=A0A9W8RL49_9HYPO|nr:hypothetical protein NW762_014721 [Fusarium torreyae]